MSSNSSSSDGQNVVSINITNMNFSTIKITGNHVRINVVNMNNSFVEIIESKIDTNAVINVAETVTGTKPEDRHVGQPHTVEDKKHPDAKTEPKKSSKMASSSWGVRMSRSSFNRKKSGRQDSNSEKL